MMRTFTTAPERTGWRGLWRDRRGIAAVEFALILPVMFATVAGLAEISNLLRVYQRLDGVAITVADLVGQDNIVTTAELTEIYNVADRVMSPYSVSNMSVLISSIQGVNDSSGTLQTTVAWSCSRPSGTALTAGAAYPLPANIVTNGNAVVVVAASYVYRPILGHVFFSQLDISASATVRPRVTTAVTKSGSCP